MRTRGGLAVTTIVMAGLAAGCGEVATSPDKVEAQIKRRLSTSPQFVECDRSSDQPNKRYTCRVETSSDRFRYVATCPSPGRPCVLERIAVAPK
jgi:hypothetical protein